jgi:hypothetical protein
MGLCLQIAFPEFHQVLMRNLYGRVLNSPIYFKEKLSRQEILFPYMRNAHAFFLYNVVFESHYINITMIVCVLQ